MAQHSLVRGRPISLILLSKYKCNTFWIGNCLDSQTEGVAPMSRVYSHIGGEKRRGHPHRDRQRHHGQADRRDAGAQRVERGQEDQTRHLIPHRNVSYRPRRPRRLKAGPLAGRYYVAGSTQRRTKTRLRQARRPACMANDSGRVCLSSF